MQSDSHKATQFLSYSIKILILAMVLFFVWKRISQDTSTIRENFKINISSLITYSNIAILLLLSIFNWLFEILKWKSLANHCHLITTKESMQQVLKAHIVSLITPAKIGEYGAKALFFPAPLRKKILFLNILGNGYQMLATTIFGSIGIGICSYFFFSFVRYLLFAHQFYFLVFLFQVDVSYPLAMGLITTMYLISSIIPMLQLFDVVLKTGVAVAVFTWVDTTEITIVCITFLMWFFNVVLPIIPGSYFMIIDTSLTSKKSMSI